MANQLIKTRIKNKIDTLAQWLEKNPVLLLGEIAFVQVPTGDTYENPVTGANEPVVELLMKVGDGVHKFNEVDDSTGKAYLPWLSAKASDVYDWAKTPDVKDVKVKVVVGQDDNKKDIVDETSLGVWLASVNTRSLANTAAIASINSSIANGVRFAGITSTNVSSETAKESKNITIDGKSYTAISGDIVIVENTTREFIWTGTEWYELGDETRIGSLEAKVSGLDIDPTASGSATAFISSIKKGDDGNLIATKANLPVADSGTAGIVKLGATSGAATYESVNGTNGAVSRIASVEGNYIKYIASDNTTPGTLSIGTSGTAADYIIFDCGGASI